MIKNWKRKVDSRSNLFEDRLVVEKLPNTFADCSKYNQILRQSPSESFILGVFKLRPILVSVLFV